MENASLLHQKTRRFAFGVRRPAPRLPFLPSTTSVSGLPSSVRTAPYRHPGRRDAAPVEYPAATDVVLVHEDDVTSASFSPDGKRILTTSSDGTARLWDAGTSAPLAVVKHEKKVNHAVFSRDGSRIVTASDDETVRVWDSSTGAPIASLKARISEERSATWSVAISHDGARVVASGHGKVRVWDVDKRSEVNVMDGGDAAFTPDGAQIMLVAEDKVCGSGMPSTRSRLALWRPTKKAR